MSEICFKPEDVKIAHYYLTESRDKTADILDHSATKVSGIWKKLETLLGPEAKDLRDLSLSIKKKGKEKSLQELLSAADLLELLRDLGLGSQQDSERTSAFLSGFLDAARESGRKPKEVVDYAVRLLDLGKRLEIHIERVPDEIEKLNHGIETLKIDLNELTRLTKEANGEKERAVRDNQLTMNWLTDYAKTKDGLKSLGCDVRDIPKLGQMMNNAKEQNYDIQGVVNQISKIQSLSGEIHDLNGTMEKMGKEELRLASNIDSLTRRNERLGIEITSLVNDGKKRLNELYDNAIEKLDKFEKELGERLKSTKGEYDAELSALNTSTKTLAGTLTSTEARVRPLLERLSTGANKALEAARQIGRIEALVPLYKLTYVEEMTQDELFPMIAVILDRLKTWVRATSSSRGVSAAGETGEEEEKEDEELVVSIDRLLVLLYARIKK